MRAGRRCPRANPPPRLHGAPATGSCGALFELDVRQASMLLPQLFELRACGGALALDLAQVASPALFVDERARPRRFDREILELAERVLQRDELLGLRSEPLQRVTPTPQTSPQTVQGNVVFGVALELVRGAPRAFLEALEHRSRVRGRELGQAV